MAGKYFDLIKKSKSFEMIKKDLFFDTLSHAYMFICRDSEYLFEYMQAVKSLFACKSENPPCGDCIGCKRAMGNVHPDIISLPAEGKKVTVADIDEVTRAAFIKPIENDRKVYFISGFQDANMQAQNKLLKTLEEPPRNVHIFLGTTGTGTVLSTIVSRVKTIEIEKISDSEIYNYILKKCGDEQKAETVTVCCDGEIGLADKIADSEEFANILSSVFFVFENLRTSRDILTCSMRLSEFKDNLNQVFSVMLSVLGDVVKYFLNIKTLFTHDRKNDIIKIADNFNLESIPEIERLIDGYNARTKVNCNSTVMIDNLLIRILEVKHKCQI